MPLNLLVRVQTGDDDLLTSSIRILCLANQPK